MKLTQICLPHLNICLTIQIIIVCAYQEWCLQRMHGFYPQERSPEPSISSTSTFQSSKAYSTYLGLCQVPQLEVATSLILEFRSQIFELTITRLRVQSLVEIINKCGHYKRPWPLGFPPHNLVPDQSGKATRWKYGNAAIDCRV